MKIFYQMDIRNQFDLDIISNEIEKINRKNEEKYFLDVLNNYLDNRELIDSRISKCVTRKLSKIGKIELSLIRIAATEISYIEDIAQEVSVNEAIEISKIYATEDSYKFINGALGKYIENNYDDGK